jgi:SAM-dependent methyltransferase
MDQVRYTHGHHDSVLRSHRWRTAENSAGYLLGHLCPGMDLLDVGCGPGTITRDLAGRVAPGSVIGLDASSAVIDEARVGAEDVVGLTFEVGDLFELWFEDEQFDVVHAHQVLQHLGDPVAALTEMRRVCRPGGIVAVRDADLLGTRFYPDDPVLDRAHAAYGTLTQVNGANWDAGRKLLHWAQEVGFSSIVPSASAWCFATPADRAWWGDLWADRYTKSAVAEQLLEHGIASPEDLASFAAAYRRWAASPDGWWAVLHSELVCTV